MKTALSRDGTPRATNCPCRPSSRFRPRPNAVPARSRALIRLVCMAKGSRLRLRCLTSAPSLMSRPNRSRSTCSIAPAECPGQSADRSQRRAVCPNAIRLQALRRSALKRLAQHGQTPPCSDTRVTSGLISGFRRGHRLRTGFALRRIRRRRSLGTRWRNIAPGSWLHEADDVPRHAAWPCPWRGWLRRFCPFDGGTLELSGVFGGRPASPQVRRSARRAPRSARPVRDQGVFLGNQAAGHRRLTHIRDVAATKKIQSQHRHLHTLKRA